MCLQLVKQPGGKWAVWSTGVGFVALGMTESDAVSYMGEAAKVSAERYARENLAVGGDPDCNWEDLWEMEKNDGI